MLFYSCTRHRKTLQGRKAVYDSCKFSNTGSIVFIPSALVTHQNISIASHKTRHAITAYTPGSIFQYETDGCCGHRPGITDGFKADGRKVWEAGIALLPRIDQVLPSNVQHWFT